MSTKDYLEKDFYQVLGVAKDASAADIKKAYRKLARTHHPDANKGDSAAEDRFKEISEAYDVLSDEKRGASTTRRARCSVGGGIRFGSGGAGGYGGPGGGCQLRPRRPVRWRRCRRRRRARRRPRRAVRTWPRARPARRCVAAPTSSPR